jgi:hypothetical protein
VNHVSIVLNDKIHMLKSGGKKSSKARGCHDTSRAIVQNQANTSIT